MRSLVDLEISTHLAGDQLDLTMDMIKDQIATLNQTLASLYHLRDTLSSLNREVEIKRGIICLEETKVNGG